MFKTVPSVSRELIEKHYSEADLLSYYAGHPFKPGMKFSSPLREDNNPSASFVLGINNQPLMYDFGLSKTYNIYSLIMEMFHCTYGEALHKIAHDMSIPHKSQNMVYTNSPKVIPKQIYDENHERLVIYSSARLPWTEETLSYWKNYRLDEHILERFNVAPVAALNINTKLVRVWDKQNPIFRYSFGEKRRFYSPLDNKMKFIGHGCLQFSKTEIGKSNVLIITKSYKDVMCYAYHGIDAIATSSESKILSEKQAQSLMSRYDMIYVNGDNDPTGLTFIEKHKMLYGFTPLLIEHASLKDFADLQRYDYLCALSIIKNL